MQRRFLPIILLLFVSVLSINCQTKSAVENIKSCKYLSLEDAGKILAQPVKTVENKEIAENNAKRFDCVYSAVSENQKNDFELRIYFSFEEFPDEIEAKKVYQTIWNSNKDHAGIEILKDVGDEAYFHTDGENFNFIMARKGKSTIRFKVRRAIKTTSIEALKSVSKKIMEQI